jgi:hypothetical protein
MSPVGVTPVAVVSHLMLDRLAWVDGRHQAVLVWTTWVALDEPGLRCYQEAVETTSRIGDGLHWEGADR